MKHPTHLVTEAKFKDYHDCGLEDRKDGVSKFKHQVECDSMIATHYWRKKKSFESRKVVSEIIMDHTRKSAGSNAIEKKFCG